MPYTYTYDHARPGVTPDILIFSIRQIERKIEPFQGHRAITGGFIRKSEDFMVGALSEQADDITDSVEWTARIDFDFLSEEFSRCKAQTAFEILCGERLEKRNFRKWIAATWWLVEIESKTEGSGFRPAAPYRLKPIDSFSTSG